jgi:hypothetical protein
MMEFIEIDRDFHRNKQEGEGRKRFFQDFCCEGGGKVGII